MTLLSFFSIDVNILACKTEMVNIIPIVIISAESILTLHAKLLSNKTFLKSDLTLYTFENTALCCTSLVVSSVGLHTHSLGPGVWAMCFDKETSVHTQVSEHVCLSCFCLDIFSDTLLCQTSRGLRRSENSPVYFSTYSNFLFMC